MSQNLCPTIVGLTFDKESKEAITAINEINKTIKYGWAAIIIGQLAQIFGGLVVKTSSSSGFVESFAFKTTMSDANQTSYSIYSSNWEYFFDALSSSG